MPTRKVMVITGASDGIGAAAARALSARGHRIVLVGRSREKTQRIAQELEQEFHVADFAELAQVRALAHLLLERHPRIDVLANNAGGVFGRNRQLTIDGHEVTFQVNYLAPFLLTSLLMERLIESRASVINTSSVANRAYGRIDLANLNGQKRYNPVTAYGNAKLAQILFTKELHHRYADRGLASAAFHPGNIATSVSTLGKARDRSRNRCRREVTPCPIPRTSRAPSASSAASRSSRTGTASSAAAVGVGARRSEA